MPNQNQSATSISLIDRIRQHDPEAWRRLVHLYAPLVHRWCTSAGCSGEDAADVTQEVFKAVFTSLDRFAKEKPDDTFRGWLRVITRNRVRDIVSRRAARASAKGGSEHQLRLNQIEFVEPTAEEQAAETKELYRCALSLIQNDFEETSWKAFFRTAVDGLNATEASQELGISPMAVRKARSRVLARLRAELGESDE